ncbi:hypothetical protein D0T84_04755 [Dysgonomonas sp. 521]|uniref:hypothetical protein n=1 Tax=Dysgonomonas sp. 521 TaxID=2302932 RepID=UPI0013D60FFD|nr:hypothetical protein [Dysgonomonas sp. 521]NDV94229.1 hypothetical protein [Dysgonomonas sp. 521]
MIKKLIYALSLLLTIGLSSCNSGGSDPDDPNPTPPIVDPKSVKEDDLLGTWEIYYSVKKVSQLLSDGSRKDFPSFRNPEYDGFINKFEKSADGTYTFENRNVVNALIDSGNYKINKDTIILSVLRHDGRDTSFVSKDVISQLYLDKSSLTVYKFFNSGSSFIVKDARSMRKYGTTIHPNVEKIDVSGNINKLLGSWEVSDYAMILNGEFLRNYSKAYLDTIKSNVYTFEYNNKNDLRCIYKYKVYDKSGNWEWTDINCPTSIVDDIIYAFYQVQDENGNRENKSFFLWVKEWNSDTFVSFNEYRTDKNPENIYTEKRWVEKVE